MEQPSLWECVTARETFIRAYQEAVSESMNSNEMCVRLAFDAVWHAAKVYQMNLDRACEALTD